MTAPHMHGVLGHDGLSPLRLLEIGRSEVAGYGVRLVHDEVLGALPQRETVEIELAAGAPVRARRLLVATGLDDELPEIGGMREQWGRGVVVCPYCDGWEHRNDVIGVVATSSGSVDQAQLMRQWSERVVFVSKANGEPHGDPARERGRRGIRVEHGVVDSIRVEGDRVIGVEVDGRVVPVGVVLTGPTPRPRDALLRSLGAATTKGPLGTTWVDIDEDGRTTVPGVWAVGNVVNARANVSVSLGLGSLVAGALNAELVREDIARASQPTAATDDGGERQAPALDGRTEVVQSEMRSHQGDLP